MTAMGKVSNGCNWSGRGSEDVNLLANNRSLGMDRGYLNYLNWVAASTGGSWPTTATAKENAVSSAKIH
jgi:hypothetical protein